MLRPDEDSDDSDYSMTLSAQGSDTSCRFERSDITGFEYIINRPPIPKVAFGSGLERETLPLKGPNMTPFMRKSLGEVREYPGPSDYELELKRRGCESKLGGYPFASRLPRLPPTEISTFPPIGAYTVDRAQPWKPAAKPFGVGSERAEPKKFLTPSPGTYDLNKKPAEYKMECLFGGERAIWPAVAVFCSPFKTVKCHKCEEAPQGDYFHNFEKELDMCRPCMRRLKATAKDCKIDTAHRIRLFTEKDSFRPVRYCDFFHSHEGTTAATNIISMKELRLKIKRENYLHLFIK